MKAALQSRLFAPLVSTAEWGGRATRAEVNLDVIAANVRELRRLVQPALLLVVAKADGYGHGSVPVARAALEAGADRIGVYTVDEAVALRLAGILAPVLVFGPFTRAEAGLIWDHDLTPMISSYEGALALQEHSRGRKLRYHVKIDTGLTRAGVEPENLLPLVAKLSTFSALEREGVFTHFARADEKAKHSTLSQFENFRQAVQRLEEAGYSFPLRHAANSSAILDLPETYLDMVRTGIGVYGYYPSGEVGRTVPLRPALSLVSNISRIHKVAKGTGVGYGHEFVCEHEASIALVPIGYGDGLPRTFGLTNGSVLVNGRPAPVVGRVSMDQITVDVSKAGKVHMGDPVTLIGDQDGTVQTADDVARQTSTISYDILTGLLPRVPRLYVRDGRIVGVRRYLPSEPTPLGDESAQA
jgi:alanine racemase